jgi:hypothetical protein
MPAPLAKLRAVLLLSALSWAAACGNSNALDPKFEPEVVNTPNVAFSFQATGLDGIDDVVTYTWNASSGSVVIHPSTATTAGTITLTLTDAADSVVYSGPVPASGDITPPAGSGGAWRVRVKLVNYSGTINFALQMQ